MKMCKTGLVVLAFVCQNVIIKCLTTVQDEGTDPGLDGKQCMFPHCAYKGGGV